MRPASLWAYASPIPICKMRELDQRRLAFSSNVKLGKGMPGLLATLRYQEAKTGFSARKASPSCAGCQEVPPRALSGFPTLRAVGAL